jgi:hypothetical protein
MAGINGEIEPPSSASLWGDMLGMGGVFRAASDPGMIGQLQQMIAAVIDGARANQRMEAKLDVVLIELARYRGEGKADEQSRRLAALPSPDGTDGA